MENQHGSDTAIIQPPQFSVGIDLGTTHSVLSYTTLSELSEPSEKPSALRILDIPQLTTPGTVEEKPQLPSFVYLPHEAELNHTDSALPWTEKPRHLIGQIARNLGSKTPLRLVSSAKSWLCHSGVDRRAPILPMGSTDEVERLSPLTASFEYLDHLRCAWDAKYPDAPLIDQDVTVTIPASFDPMARELTAEAASMVGFKQLTLLEEPMAAVYNWVHESGDQWREQVSVGDVILVVDIGGGTTDLSLVCVDESDGELSLNRIAVGEHILLGGDNMDLALAYRVRAKLAEQGKKIEPWQIQAICQACRDAKEVLLSDNEVQHVPITVPSRGSKLFGGALRCELTRDEVTQTLIEGFFPPADIQDEPKQSTRSALTQRGLPYAQDPGISRHIAAFLTKQKNAATATAPDEDAGDPLAHFADPLGSDPLGSLDPLQTSSTEFIKPNAILFNGGVLKAPRVKSRLLGLINTWLQNAGSTPATELTGADLDLAVAKGASYYGRVRQGHGVRIRGGLANAYYVGIESTMPAIPGMEPPLEALCIAPFGLEEGERADSGSREFGLVIGESVHFRFFGSSTRRHDTAGTLLAQWDDDDLSELPSINVTLPVEGDRKAGDVIPVRLAAYVTEIGTLKLEAIGIERANANSEPTSTHDVTDALRWHVEFDVRD